MGDKVASASPRDVHIVIDAAILHGEQVFGRMGRVTAVAGTAVTPELVRDADVLVTRSVTKVNAALVNGSRLSMVATATAGIDHVDTQALAAAGIAFASAAGCNAQAVAQYVLAALLEVAHRRQIAIRGPVGIVGFGHVGRRVATVLRAYGLAVMACDPPLALRREQDVSAIDVPAIDFNAEMDALARSEPLHSLPELTARCAVLSMHVPKTTTGPHRTVGLLGRDVLAALRSGTIVLNTCRGGVVDEAALIPWLASGRGHAVLDVFEGEPNLAHPSLLDPSVGAALVTPHIAGYTREGKRAATELAAQAVARHLGLPTEDLSPMPADVASNARMALPDTDDPLAALLRTHAGLGEDDQRLRDLAALAPDVRGRGFEALRRTYRMRTQWAATRVTELDAHPDLVPRLRKLGFSTE